MDTEPTNGTWEEQKKKLKARFISLTNSDLIYEAGKRDEMFIKLRTKLGISRKEMTAILSSL
jgi:hypothetical protein